LPRQHREEAATRRTAAALIQPKSDGNDPSTPPHRLVPLRTARTWWRSMSRSWAVAQAAGSGRAVSPRRSPRPATCVP